MRTMQRVEQRAALRIPTDLRADCRMAGRSWDVRLCNISAAGCMMICPDEGLPEGWMLRLRVPSLPAIDSEIIWQRRGQAGLNFLVPLHSDSMEHLGVRLPDPAHRRAPPLRPHQMPETAGLHAQLVKRGALPEGPLADSASPKALVR
jgi:hypothetical protein